MNQLSLILWFHKEVNYETNWELRFRIGEHGTLEIGIVHYPDHLDKGVYQEVRHCYSIMSLTRLSHKDTLIEVIQEQMRRDINRLKNT